MKIALRMKHPIRNRAERAVRSLAEDLLPVPGPSSPADRQGQTEKWMPTVVEGYDLETMGIMCVIPWEPTLARY